MHRLFKKQKSIFNVFRPKEVVPHLISGNQVQAPNYGLFNYQDNLLIATISGKVQIR